MDAFADVASGHLTVSIGDTPERCGGAAMRSDLPLMAVSRTRSTAPA
jgi:hypothetical protein